MSWDPRLIAVAREITLRHGFPYTDPRTGRTEQPPKSGRQSGRRKPAKRKKKKK